VSKSGKTLIPTDKPQVYFVDVVKCINKVCSQRWCVAQVNLRTWIAWEIWYHWLTDQLPWSAYPGLTIAGGHAGRLDKESDW